MARVPKRSGAPRVVELENVTITSEGILFRGGAVMAESFARDENFRRWNRKRGAKRFEQNLKLRPTRKLDSVVWVTDDWSKGYFHWVADVLPRLVIAADYSESSPVMLPARFRDSQIVGDSLGLLGVTDFDFLADGEAVQVRRMFLPNQSERSGEFDRSVMNEVRRILTRTSAADETPTRRVYISRERAKRRKVANEDEVLRVLGDFGFKKVVAEEMSFPEQIRLFSSVDRLVSVHGAGMANMLFMPAGGRVLELRKNDPRADNCFLNLAAALGHQFHDQTCPAIDDQQAPYTADLIVDTKLLLGRTQQFLEAR
jgi:capsular polysaccharide biosynthesis protein